MVKSDAFGRYYYKLFIFIFAWEWLEAFDSATLTPTIYQRGGKANLSLVYRQLHNSRADDTKIQARSLSCVFFHLICLAYSVLFFLLGLPSSLSFTSLIPGLIQRKGQKIHQVIYLALPLSAKGYC